MALKPVPRQSYFLTKIRRPVTKFVTFPRMCYADANITNQKPGSYSQICRLEYMLIMIKWCALLSLAMLVGGCATNPSNLSWEDRPQIILPPVESVPPTVVPQPIDTDSAS